MRTTPTSIPLIFGMMVLRPHGNISSSLGVLNRLVDTEIHQINDSLRKSHQLVSSSEELLHYFEEVLHPPCWKVESSMNCHLLNYASLSLYCHCYMSVISCIHEPLIFEEVAI